MSEEKELCPKCGSVDFIIIRDMTSRRVCKCSHTWAAPEKKDTGYKKLKRESEEYFAKWGEYMKRAHAAEAQVEELSKEIERLKQCCKDFEFVLEGSRPVKQSDEMLEKREDALMRALDWEK